MSKTVLHQIASSFNAMKRCQETGNEEWYEKHRETIEDLCDNRLPCGSGFDSGTQFDYEASRDNRLVFTTSFHHMDEYGGYCGWSDHEVIVQPDLIHGFTMRITGRNVRDVKDYMYEVFYWALAESLESEQLPEQPHCECADCQLVRTVRQFLDHTTGFEALRGAVEVF